MAITGAITAAATIGSAVIGNQQKQKAKGQAAQVERDATTAQNAADAKLAQQHTEDIQSQSQAGAVARKAMGGTVDQFGTIVQGDPSRYTGGKSAGAFQPQPPNVHTLLGSPQQPIQRKALLGS